MYFLGIFWDVVFSDGKVHGAIGLAISSWILRREVGISQSVAPREPSSALYLTAYAPASPCRGGRVWVGWDPKPMPNFFWPRVGSVVWGHSTVYPMSCGSVVEGL